MTIISAKEGKGFLPLDWFFGPTEKRGKIFISGSFFIKLQFIVV